MDAHHRSRDWVREVHLVALVKCPGRDVLCLQRGSSRQPRLPRRTQAIRVERGTVVPMVSTAARRAASVGCTYRWSIS